MTDRELLELAARAVGHQPGKWVGETPIIYNHEGHSAWAWSPLNDDGDAFRLAAKLGLFASPSHALGFVAAMGDTDPAAATRRFIVEAAAGIGEGMK